jgi:Carboxypeptidase regulatory-like domain/Cytochrome c554 and c-prime
MKRSAFPARPWVAAAFLTLGLAACKGDTGPAGASAIDRGTIAGTVKDMASAPVAGATVKTDPGAFTAQTDNSGAFTLTSVPIGAYSVVASKAGYADGTLTGVGVGAGGTVNVSLVLAAVPPTTGSLSGTIFGRQGTPGASSAVTGAQACVGTSVCSPPTGSDGKYTISGVSPGFVFVTASAPGFLPGETRQAAFLAAGGTAAGVDVTLSGMPSASATYVGSNTCVACHTSVSPAVVSAWQGSAHARAVARTTGQVDVTGWPAAPVVGTACAAPNTLNTGVTATDPATQLTGTVWLVRREATCTPVFSMAFGTSTTLNLATATIIPVSGTAGGVATGAGQCGNGGMIPANALCSTGWWQQEYLVAIGGASKPAWVTWNTTATPNDMLVLPAAWNQRSRAWANAPDYNPTQSMAWSKACSGCHETGLSLVADASGNVTSYSATSSDIGCEKCHGPGSDHVAQGGKAQLIINPAYLTAQSEREVCGQCHSQGVASASDSGAFGFAWNSAAAVGGGNFIPGVHVLSNFQSAPAYGDSGFYWPSGFPSSDHETYIDFGANVHANNSFEKLTCANCHSGHGGTGGPFEIQKASAAGDAYVFQKNDAVLRDDVMCLSCHATFGPFSSVALEDVANYHVMEGGAALKNGTGMTPTTDVQAASTSVIASAVNAHMMDAAKMPAYFDPTGAVSGMPVGRCSSCHMAKTAFTGTYFSGLDASGRTANLIGDVSAHTFKVAWPDMSLATWGAAATWDGVMPNACGSCHAAYRFGK